MKTGILTVRVTDKEAEIDVEVQVKGSIKDDVKTLSKKIIAAVRKVEKSFEADLEDLVVEVDLAAKNWRLVVWNWDDGCEMPLVFLIQYDLDAMDD